MKPFTGEFTLTRLERAISGAGTLAALGAELDRLACSRAVVVTGRTLGASQLFHGVTGALGARVAGVFPGARQHVPGSTVCELADVIRRSKADCVVSFGGGSPIDTAKAAIHMLLVRPAGDGAAGGDAPIHIAVPTTLSAGEFTALAGVTDDETRVKRAVADPRLAARIVIMDPAVTLDTPRWLWAASGVRALDHAIESIYSNRHHPLSDALASKAIRLLTTHLPASLDAASPTRLDDRATCQMAAWLSVFGIINAGFGLSHVLGHQIGPRWDVPHGVTSCIMLPHAMRFMARLAPHRFGPIAEGYGLAFDPADPTPAALACAERTQQFIAALDLPTSLREVRVPRHEIDGIAAIVHEALEDARAVDRPVGRDELLAVIAAAY